MTKDVPPPAHNMACSNLDFDFFYEGLENHTLLVQRCSDCDDRRNPPAPMCRICGSFKWTSAPLSGEGTIQSYVIHHHPPLPTFPTPHAVLVVDMAEGVRFVGAGRDDDQEGLAIGLPVEIEFVRHGDVASFQFKLAATGR